MSVALVTSRRPAVPVETIAPTGEAEALSAAVAAVYDAAIDPPRWAAALGAARDYIGGYSAAICRKELSGLNGTIYHADGVVDRHWSRLYFERYSQFDPCNASHFFAELEAPISTTDIMGYEDFRQSRFFSEWVAPQGLVDFVSAAIEKGSGGVAMFGVFRHQRDGMVDEATRQRTRLLVPHIRRAVLIGQVIEEGSLQAASFRDALDGLASGLFFVDAGGRVVHANAAGADMLREGRAVAAGPGAGRLVTPDRAASAALTGIFAAAPTGDDAVGTRGISVPIEARDGSRFVAHVLPLTSGARRRTGAHYAAAAAVFVHPATLHTPAAPEVMARTFGLTQSELRVLLTIIQAGGVAETADTLGIAETTVKTHLHRVFAKTGTSRQAELVRLVAGFASPLAP